MQRVRTAALAIGLSPPLTLFWRSLRYVGEGTKAVFVAAVPYLAMREFATGLGLLGLQEIDVVCDLCEQR